MAHEGINPPQCIEDGVPPCPLCPVRDKCKWAAKVLAPEDSVKARQAQKEVA